LAGIATQAHRHRVIDSTPAAMTQSMLAGHHGLRGKCSACWTSRTRSIEVPGTPSGSLEA